MIRHIFKIIWKEKRNNLWILFELILVFTILWFFIDIIYYMTKMHFEPKGFDITHTYLIDVGRKVDDHEGYMRYFDTDEDDKLTTQEEQELNEMLTILERIKSHPGIENVCISSTAHPYSVSSSWGGYRVDSILNKNTCSNKYVTPEFFDVFKINIEHGRNFTPDETSVSNVVILSPKGNKTFNTIPVDRIKEISMTGKDSMPLTVIGSTGATKTHIYNDYDQIVYYPLGRNSRQIIRFSDICVRVKPNADFNFAETFMKEMSEQLTLEYFYLDNVISLSQLESRYFKDYDYDSMFRMIGSFSVFLIINIFLGVIGTFWFRIQTRRSEIGLRQAIGASKAKVKRMLIAESLLLLFIASVIAMILVVNLSETHIIYAIDLVAGNMGHNDNSIEQYLINYIITFLFLAGIIAISTWYPANKAAEVEPTDVLHED